MTRQPLFLCQNGRRGDVVLSRAVFAAAARSGRFDLVLGCCRDDAPLLADLAGPHSRIAAGAFANTPHGAPLDLRHLNDDGRPALAIWLGGNEAWPSYQWADTVRSFDRALARLGIDCALGDAAAATVPMLDFAGEVALPALRRQTIYLDNARTLHEPSHFVFDFERLCDVLPDHDFVCTAPVPEPQPALLDGSGLSPLQRSRLSDRCQLLVGTTFDPFVLTLTEANRSKPKAMCGHDARTTPVPWDYPGNPLELLATMDDLIDFLLANVAVEARR